MAFGLGAVAFESQMILETIQRRLKETGLTDDQVEAVVSLAFQRAQWTAISPFDSLRQSLERLQRERYRFNESSGKSFAEMYPLAGWK